MDRITRESRLVSEEFLLFPRKWDRSRWQLRFNINGPVGTVEADVLGWGGNNGELIVLQSCHYRPAAEWGDVLENASTFLLSHLENQLEPYRLPARS